MAKNGIIVMFGFYKGVLNMKRIISLIIMLVMLAGIMPAVYASPCCELGIESITQENDIVTVNYSYMNNYVTNREILLTVKPLNSWDTAVEESHYVSEWISEGAFTFSSEDFLNGSTYTVEIYYTSVCENEYCDYHIGDSCDITIKGGIPVIEFDSLIDGKLELVGKSSAYLSITAKESGFYSLGAVTYDKWDDYYYDDWSIRFIKYPNNQYIYPDDITYMSAGETTIYSVSKNNGSDLSTTIKFELNKLNVFTPIINNPQTTTKLYSISGVSGVCEITIPKYGMYNFSVSGNEEYDSNFNIIDENGNHVDNGWGELTRILKDGTYYINTSSMGDNFTLDITYTIPEAVEFGKENTLAANDEATFSIKISKPVIITLTGANASMENDNNHYSFYENEQTAVVKPGEYFVTARNYSDENIQWTITQTEMPSMELDVASKATISVDYRRFIAFCAPEDGKYEFDFSNCNDYNIETSDDYSSATYRTIDLKKDEWVLISLYSDDDEVTVRKYVAPTAIALSFDEAAYYDYYSGKTYLYSFTPSEDGSYKIMSNNNYCDNLKIYTDNEVLYKSASAMWGYSKILELKKDVTVYIELWGNSSIGGTVSQNEIKVTNAYTELTNGQTISLSSSEDLTMCYTVPEAGFYDVELAKTGSWRYAEIQINDHNYYVYNGYPTSTAIYRNEGDKIYFTFYKYTSGRSDVTVNISKIIPEVLTKDVETSLTEGSYYSFTPSQNAIYTITNDLQYGTVDVITKEHSNIALETHDAQFFNGETGTTYILRPHYNMTAKISDAVVTEITTDTTYNAGAENEIFVFNVPKEGYYKIDTSLYNSEIYVWGGDYWYTVSNTFYYMHKLDKGLFPIIYIPQYYYEDQTFSVSAGSGCISNTIKLPTGGGGSAGGGSGSAGGGGGGSSSMRAFSSAQFTLYEATDSQTLGISVDNCFMTPSYNGLAGAVQLTVTAPYAVNDIKAGIEYSGPDIEGSQSVMEPEMKFSDIQHIETEISGLKTGKTYSIKPFIYVGDDYENKIYGEEKIFTMKMRSDITTLDSNSYEFKAEGRNKFNRYGNDYYFEFTQPESGTTEITTNYIISNINIYDANGSQINADWNDTYDGKIATLAAGQKYYIVASTYEDGDAEIKISSLPEAYSLGITSFTRAEINCEISGSGKEAVLYAAFYDGTRLVSVAAYENPEANVSVEISKMADSCKLMLVEKGTLAPLCANEQLPLYY